MKASHIAVLVVLASLSTVPLHAQEKNLPNAPTVAKTHNSFELDTDAPYFATIFAGGGDYLASGSHANSTQFGFEAGTELFGRKIGTVEFVELGALGPLFDRNSPATFTSFDVGPMLRVKPHDVIFTPAGYSYVFGEGHSINYGLGWSHHYKTYRAISVEIRDYYIFTQTHQQNIALRIGWQFLVHDP